MTPIEGKEFEFENKTVGGVIPREYMAAIEKGVREALEKGVLLGHPLINIKVDLVDGSYHEVDSSELAFKLAASIGVKEAVRKANPIILEPVMKVDLTVPARLSGCRGRGHQQPQGKDCRDRRQKRGEVRASPSASRRDVRLYDPPSLDHPGQGQL